MEFELERTQLDGYEVLLDTTVLREETLEMIVPDACPDILRILETDGTVLLRQRTAQDGRGEVEGTFQLEVLYLPDGEEGVRSLTVSIPFTCGVEAAAITPSCRLLSALRLRHADTRVINPRKVLVRGEAAADITIYTPVHAEISSGLHAAEEAGLEQLVEAQEIYLTNAVEEKSFELSENLPISSGKPPALELLKYRMELCQGENKLIGNKLIFKGDIRLCVVYRGEDQNIYTSSGELPYSQIMEVSGAGEEADRELTLTVTELTCKLSPEDEGHSIDVSAQILAQVVIRENRQMEVLRDAYCTKQAARCDWQQYPIQERQDLGSRNQNVRELWETPTPVREVLDSSLIIGQLTRSQEGERLILTAQVEVNVLYQGEDGGIYATQRQLSVPCTLELPESCRCLCQCEEVGEAYSAPAAGGVETRFALAFHYCALRPGMMNVLEALQPVEEPEDAGERPSLVLRALEGGERLWDVAKAYRTTTSDIISANELADEAAARGRLLLIPRKR